MPYLDLAAGNAALKELYDGQTVQKLTYEDNPTAALLTKDEDFVGEYYPIPVRYENSQGRSATFANAQANQTATALAKFLLTRKKDYSIATIDNETLEAAMSDRGSFMRLATELIDSATSSAGVSLSSSLFRSGTGSIGQMHATTAISTGVITLSSPADVVQFAVGQTLQANATDGGTPRAALGYVIARSIRNGTITVSSTALGGSAGSPSGWTTSDYLLVQGDLNAKLSGFPAWLPTTDPSSTDNFYGVNRSVDYRLFGVSYDGSGQTIEEALIDHAMLLAREGSKPTHFPTNFGSIAGLTKALGTRKIYEDMEGPAGIGFRALSIDGPKGPIKAYGDRSCPPLKGFMLQLDTWTLSSLGPMPKILKYEERTEMLRVYNADASEARIGGYANLGCKKPARNGTTLLST